MTSSISTSSHLHVINFTSNHSPHKEEAFNHSGIFKNPTHGFGREWSPWPSLRKFFKVTMIFMPSPSYFEFIRVSHVIWVPLLDFLRFLWKPLKMRHYKSCFLWNWFCFCDLCWTLITLVRLEFQNDVSLMWTPKKHHFSPFKIEWVFDLEC